ncbi:MAG: hypothetical protein Q8K63_04590 [Acidimicrobiales bacterium]|nr:hypothetical protein [Acidimicrobiales bacterium]
MRIRSRALVCTFLIADGELVLGDVSEQDELEIALAGFGGETRSPAHAALRALRSFNSRPSKQSVVAIVNGVDRALLGDVAFVGIATLGRPHAARAWLGIEAMSPSRTRTVLAAVVKARVGRRPGPRELRIHRRVEQLWARDRRRLQLRARSV